jgi:hypothetical protein
VGVTKHNVVITITRVKSPVHTPEPHKARATAAAVGKARQHASSPAAIAVVHERPLQRLLAFSLPKAQELLAVPVVTPRSVLNDR